MYRCLTDLSLSTDLLGNVQHFPSVALPVAYSEYLNSSSFSFPVFLVRLAVRILPLSCPLLEKLGCIVALYSPAFGFDEKRQ